MPWPAVPTLTAPWTSCGHDREVTGPLWVSVWGFVSFAGAGAPSLAYAYKAPSPCIPFGF